MRNPSIHQNNNTVERYCQYLVKDIIPSGEVLTDTAHDGSERPWREKKMNNLRLAEVYGEFDEVKQARLLDCGKYLDFKVYADGKKKLHSMSSCRVRLCPICAWRRSLKTFYNNLEITRYLQKDHNYNFIFLTFTIRNVWGPELGSALDEINKAINRLYLRPEWKKAVKGACRCLEVTHNVKKSSEWYNSFHPHVHFMVAVNKSYFTSRAYLTQKKWADLWASVMHIDYEPHVYVEKCYGTMEKAVAECSKYSVKDAEYIIPEEWDLTVETVKLLDEVLANRRLISYSGCFKVARAALKLEDEETGSLVNVGEPGEENTEKDYIIQTYYWYSGYRQYVSIN